MGSQCTLAVTGWVRKLPPVLAANPALVSIVRYGRCRNRTASRSARRAAGCARRASASSRSPTGSRSQRRCPRTGPTGWRNDHAPQVRRLLQRRHPLETHPQGGQIHPGDYVAVQPVLRRDPLDRVVAVAALGPPPGGTRRAGVAPPAASIQTKLLPVGDVARLSRAWCSPLFLLYGMQATSMMHGSRCCRCGKHRRTAACSAASGPGCSSRPAASSSFPVMG